MSSSSNRAGTSSNRAGAGTSSNAWRRVAGAISGAVAHSISRTAPSGSPEYLESLELARRIRRGNSDGSIDSSGASSNSGEIAELPSKEEIIKALECPICQEVCVPPIWNCINGHIVCNTCRPHIEECALCKNPISQSRNYPLEAIALNSKFYCQYKPEGCSMVLLGDQFGQHVRSCMFRHRRPRTVSRSESLASGSVDVEYSDYNTGHRQALHFQLVDSDEEPEPPLPEAFQTSAWVRASNGNVPENAVVAGQTHSGEEMYVIRAYEGHLAIAGQLCPSDRAAYIVSNGILRRKWYYDVLVAIPGTFRWMNYRIQRNSISPLYPYGTVTPEPLSQYAVARAKHNGEYICGSCDQNGFHYKNGRIVSHVIQNFQILLHGD